MSFNRLHREAIASAYCMRGIALAMACACCIWAGVRETPAVMAVRKALPAVVSIGAERRAVASDPYVTLLQEFFSLYPSNARMVQKYSPLGSGVVIDKTGLVLTNWHVVRAAEGQLQISLPDERKCQAELVGYDVNSDLCLLQAVGMESGYLFQEASFAGADDLLLGETVLALGNPYGLERSVSQGLLSAVNRSLGDDYCDMLQTDAAINPGNSGGPLINLEGDVMGINQAIRSQAQGIGFAIPVKRVENFLGQWLLSETFSDVALGIRIEQRKDGVFVNQARDGIGIKRGEQIIGVPGNAVRNVLDYCRCTWHCKEGDKVELLLKGGRKVTLTAQKMSDAELVAYRLGLRLQKLTPALCSAMGISEDSVGLVVTEVIKEEEYRSSGSQWRGNLQRGDILLGIDGKRVQNLADVASLLRKGISGSSVRADFAVFDRRSGYLRYKEHIILK